MKIVGSTKATGSRLADRIRIARHAAKLSQAALAARVGVTPGAVAQWESPDGTKPASNDWKPLPPPPARYSTGLPSAAATRDGAKPLPIRRRQ